MATNWQDRAEEFVRRHWAGGIGEPDVSAQNILDVVDDIYRAATEAGMPWQSHATLEWEDDYVLWISGSGHGALLWTPEGCWGFDAGTTENLVPWAVSGIFQIPSSIHLSGVYRNDESHPAVAWGNLLLRHSTAWRQNHPEWFGQA